MKCKGITPDQTPCRITEYLVDEFAGNCRGQNPPLIQNQTARCRSEWTDELAKRLFGARRDYRAQTGRPPKDPLKTVALLLADPEGRTSPIIRLPLRNSVDHNGKPWISTDPMMSAVPVQAEPAFFLPLLPFPLPSVLASALFHVTVTSWPGSGGKVPDVTVPVSMSRYLNSVTSSVPKA